MLQHPNPITRHTLKELFLSEIPVRRLESFCKQSQPVLFAIGLMGWGLIQRLWLMRFPWVLPFPPLLPLSLLPH